MAVILPFAPDKRRRFSPARPGERRGEIVIFHGVRIDRPPTDTQETPEPGQRRPSPGIRS
jgi:hypothetical protein